MAISKDKSPVSNRSLSQSRLQSCTHQHVTRLFDEFGCDQCSICRKRPPLGWLYRCTQASEGVLPVSDFYNVQDVSIRPNQDARIYTLSPSINKAISQNLYTDDEVIRLVLQKENVRRTIFASRPTTASAFSSMSSLDSIPDETSTTISSVVSPHSDSNLDLFQESLTKPEQLNSDTGNHKRTQISTLSLRPKVYAPFTPVTCDFKVCQTCRPIYRDRAWGSINTILNSIYQPPPTYELKNRRISDVNIVKRMGELKWGYRHYALYNWEIDSTKSKRNSRKEFQDTVRRMLRNSQFFTFDNDQNLEPSVEEAEQFDYARKYAPRDTGLIKYNPASSLNFTRDTRSEPSLPTIIRPSLVNTSCVGRGIKILKTVHAPSSLSMNALDISCRAQTEQVLSEERSMVGHWKDDIQYGMGSFKDNIHEQTEEQTYLQTKSAIRFEIDGT